MNRRSRIHAEHNKALANIQTNLRKLMSDIEKLQGKQ